MAIYDLKYMILPDQIMYGLIYLSLGFLLVDIFVFDGGVARVREAVLSVAIGGGLFYLIYVVSKGRWIGGGDVKLGILMGLFLTYQQSILSIYIGSMLGTVVACLCFLPKN